MRQSGVVTDVAVAVVTVAVVALHVVKLAVVAVNVVSLEVVDDNELDVRAPTVPPVAEKVPPTVALPATFKFAIFNVPMLAVVHIVWTAVRLVEFNVPHVAEKNAPVVPL